MLQVESSQFTNKTPHYQPPLLYLLSLCDDALMLQVYDQMMIDMLPRGPAHVKETWQRYTYEHIRRTELVDLEVHEVITGASLSTGTSPITESIAPLNPGINPGKCEHPCQVEDLNLGGHVPPQGTHPTDL
jgi:hypothetical protein